jgi:hypothetical protein
MLRNRKAILPLLAVIFILFFDVSVSAQCGAGKIPMTVQGFGSILTVNSAFSNGAFSLGAPNGNGANFSSGGQFIIIDLIDTVRAGQTYSITWRQYPGEGGTSVLNWSESLDGSTFTVHPSSVIGTTNERYFRTDIVANSDTRFILIFTKTTNDLSVDAISYTATKCFTDPCGAGLTASLISGNAYYTEQSSITNPANADYVPDGSGALFNSGTDRLVLRLPNAIPSGQNYQIIWRPAENGAQMRIRESENGSSWSPAKLSPSYSTSSIFIIHTETTGTVTRYIEITGTSNQDFYLDAIVFHAITCNPSPPDLDVEGSYTYCGSPIFIAPGLTLTDPANQIINAAYVQVGTNYTAGQDRLECTVNYGITANWNSTYGVLYLSGQATTAQYESV